MCDVNITISIDLTTFKLLEETLNLYAEHIEVQSGKKLEYFNPDRYMRKVISNSIVHYAEWVKYDIAHIRKKEV